MIPSRQFTREYGPAGAALFAGWAKSADFGPLHEDFNVWSKKKRVEKLHYMHMNPAKRGLVADPKLWAWSSHRFHQFGERKVCTPDPTPK